MNRQRVYQSRSQSKSSGIEVSGVLQRRGLVRTASEPTRQSEKETKKHSWSESPLEKNYKPVPVRSPKARFQRALPENEVEPSVVGESGLNRSFVNVPAHGNRLPVVQRSPQQQAQLWQHPDTETPTASVGDRVSQGKINKTGNCQVSPERQRPNQTGLPDRLKTGIEDLSGYSLDDVRVHYNSARPAQLNALAYTQGTDIHVGPRQERHLPHEGWHVVQQMQGRVRPTMHLKGANVNDDVGLEREADVMGAKALQQEHGARKPDALNSELIANATTPKKSSGKPFSQLQAPIQRLISGPTVSGHFTTIPNGTLVPTWDNSANVLTTKFHMNATFDVPKSTKGGRGEYRQYIKGYFKTNGVLDDHTLIGAEKLDANTWKEDGDATGGYGYHNSQTTGNKYTETSTGKEMYKGIDNPESNTPSVGKEAEMNLNFKGQLVDADAKGATTSVIVEKTWNVIGKDTRTS
ncbi:MAG: DUF4157 domain-containing protein [Xenococcus sp. MO_188.B8]|nr:DUF4157 domain-containing protein [Xenococcus sp. MO_188.B8]